MKRQKPILRPLGAGLDDCYSQSELFAACQQEIFANCKVMNTNLLLELLQTLDDRPNEAIAPHQEAVWAIVQRRIRPPIARVQMARNKFALVVVLVVLLLALVGGCLAWAISAGVIAFPSTVLHGLPQVTGPEAEALVQKDLFYAQYEHSELRVLEAAYDGHQIRIVYSLRDTRPNPALIEQDLWSASIPAAQLDGIGCCDYLTLNGQDVFLDDTYQMLGEQDGKILYYVAANVPEDVALQDVITVQMPIGRLNVQTGQRAHDDVAFSLDTKAGLSTAFFAKHADVFWGNTRIVLQQASFSPLHGYIKVATYPVEAKQPYDHFMPRLYTLSGEAIEQEWYHEDGATQEGGSIWILHYIPALPWPDQMLLAEVTQDGVPNPQRSLALTLQPQNEK